MTSRFKWPQQQKNITSTTYNLHIQGEQTICQKRTEQKIAPKRKQIVYSVITTDLLTCNTHFPYTFGRNCRFLSKLQSYIKTKIPNSRQSTCWQGTHMLQDHDLACTKSHIHVQERRKDKRFAASYIAAWVILKDTHSWRTQKVVVFFWTRSFETTL